MTPLRRIGRASRTSVRVWHLLTKMASRPAKGPSRSDALARGQEDLFRSSLTIPSSFIPRADGGDDLLVHFVGLQGPKQMTRATPCVVLDRFQFVAVEADEEVGREEVGAILG